MNKNMFLTKVKLNGGLYEHWRHGGQRFYWDNPLYSHSGELSPEEHAIVSTLYKKTTAAELWFDPDHFVASGEAVVNRNNLSEWEDHPQIYITGRHVEWFSDDVVITFVVDGLKADDLPPALSFSFEEDRGEPFYVKRAHWESATFRRHHIQDERVDEEWNGIVYHWTLKDE